MFIISDPTTVGLSVEQIVADPTTVVEIFPVENALETQEELNPGTILTVEAERTALTTLYLKSKNYHANGELV